jgi:flavin reductase (DIM6/NTAB) family NADH-FMN oxidoreductase RutF
MKSVTVDEAIKKRVPEYVGLVVCKNDKKVSVTPIGWFTLCNGDPRSWAICLANTHYSHKVISETKEFTLNIPSFAQKDDILYCGSVSGWDTDKLKNCKLETIESKQVKPPLLKDSIACFECKVTKTLNVGDSTIFVGEIVEAYISDRKDKVYNLGNRNLIEWDLK